MLSHPTADQIAATPPLEFTPDELPAMHRWCFKYRDLVHSDKTPTPEQNAQFLLFSRVAYAEGACDA